MMTISYPNGKLNLNANPQAIQFGYSLNTATFETTAGKVTQILSTNIDTLTVNAKIGSSKNSVNESYQRYIAMVRFCRQVMIWQAKNNKPIDFNFPTLNYHLKVFLRQQTFTDNFNQVSFPYTLAFSVDEDVMGTVKSDSVRSVLDKVKSGVGFIPGDEGWHGGGTSDYDPDIRPAAGGGGGNPNLML